jgi:glycosyltransferase involved in cell wall biosynthesis
MKFLLKIPLSTYTGYGRDGLGMAQALIRAGHDVYLQPSEVQAPLPEDVAQLLTKPLEAPFDVTIVHLDPSRLGVEPEYKHVTKKLIAWSMWEWESFDNLKGKSKLRKELRDYDAIIGYDEVTANCFREYYKGPIHVLQGGFDAKELDYLERDWDGNFRFCMLGVLSMRKNPYVAIRAFTELCDEDPDFNDKARLVLKTVAPPGYFVRMEEVYPNLRILYGHWSRETIIDFYQSMHVLLAPSWGEGKNLPALEFMTTGGGVIATNWGGMSYWMDEDYAYPLKFDLDVMDQTAAVKVRAAKADLADLKAQMRHAFYNREEVRQKGLLASKVVPEEFSWDRVIDKLTSDVLPEVPEREITHESYRD